MAGESAMPLKNPTPGRAHLRELLSRRNRDLGSREAIDREILERFQRRLAVLVLDMRHFTSTTSRRGILHDLAMIERMEAARPAIEENGGAVVTREADNLFAAFLHPRNAVEAALDVFRAFEAVNRVVPDERELYGCIGIGFGDVLLVGRSDLFGHEVNLACKLGEDFALPGEILLTRAARDALPCGACRMTPRPYKLGGDTVEVFVFEGRAAGAIG
jgi:adenylate cyclase